MFLEDVGKGSRSSSVPFLMAKRVQGRMAGCSEQDTLGVMLMVQSFSLLYILEILSNSLST